jgi:hypothetical protein
MDEENWSVDERDLSILTNSEATNMPSERKRRIHGENREVMQVY